LEETWLNSVSHKDEILAELERVFGDENAIPEWDVARNSGDTLTRELYCPRIDFAVGPFNTDANTIENIRLINESCEKFDGLLHRLRLTSDNRNLSLNPNRNPRCFLAIELENKTSRKHRLGSLVNASAMGKIGIVVASNERVFTSFAKIRKYLDFLESVSKTSYSPKNAIILTEEDFLRTLKD
jgi:hypothetical protein